MWRDTRRPLGDDVPMLGRSRRQELRFVTTPDGVRIAYARQGQGPPLVRAAHWLSHLEFDWQSPVWRDFLWQLADGRTLVRYDERGTGLSDREVADLSFEAMVGDLEVVVDTLGLERFSLLGMSQGGAISIAYAVRHPERVSALVLCGAYARGHEHPLRPVQQRDDAEILLNLIRAGWGTPDPKFRRVFASMFLPDGSGEHYEAFDALQRVSASAEVAYRLRSMFGQIDVTELSTQVRVPTLVMHARDDGVVPFEEGRLLASLIPGARFVPLEGRSHILLSGDPAARSFFAELKAFLTEVERSGPTGPSDSEADRDAAVGSLSARERDVMAMVVEGRTNQQIADALFLSPRTVERHLSNVYAKLGLEGKAARAGAAARLSRTLPSGPLPQRTSIPK
jgi:pimeloyl-ACP methyl ester carboxylesterase/DNA-binding CsgD family transcriptional regulator